MFSYASKHNDAKAHLSWRERIGYGIGNYGMAWINGIMSAFFMLYLTNVSFVDAGVAGVLIAVSKVFDGVSDLIMGGIVDRTKSRFGKARVWLLRMCIPLSISTFLLFSIPSSWSDMVKYVYMFILYNLVNSVFYTSMYVPYNSMNYLMTQNTYDRGVLGNMNMIFQTLANITMNTFFISWLNFFGKGDMYDQQAWTKTFIIIGLIVIAASILCFFGTKERTAASVQQTEDKKDSVSPLVAVKALFKNKYWAIMTICMFLTPAFMKKFGKHRTYQVGLFAIIIGFAGTGLCGTNLPLLILFNIIKGIGLGASGGMAFGMVSDTIECGEWKNGVVTVGMGNAGISAAQKLGLGLGQAVLGWVLAGSGFNSTEAVQSAAAQNAISFCYNWIPVICVALCIILMFFYRLDKEMPLIRQDMTKRRKNS